MPDEHITTSRDPNYLGQASLDFHRAGNSGNELFGSNVGLPRTVTAHTLLASHYTHLVDPVVLVRLPPGWWPWAMATRHVVHGAPPSTKVSGQVLAGRLGVPSF